MQIRCVFGLSCKKKLHLDGSDHLGCFVRGVKKNQGTLQFHGVLNCGFMKLSEWLFDFWWFLC